MKTAASKVENVSIGGLSTGGALSFYTAVNKNDISGALYLFSAALDLAWVAAGRYEGYWELGIAPWDGAAGMLLVREAGGMVTDPFGRTSTPFMGLVVSSNGHIHDRFREVVESWMPMRLVDP